MDEGLFKKHILRLQIRNNSKNELLEYIKKETGIELQETSINISNKDIIFTVSSVVKQKLFQKNITKLLTQKGFTTKF